MKSMRRYWDNRYRTQGRIYGRDPSELARWAIRCGVLVRSQRLIEMGCGTGRNSIFFARCGLEVTGVDISSVALDLAKQDAIEAGTQVVWFLGDITNLGESVKSNTFDVVFSNFCLHLLDKDDCQAAVREIYRLLVGGGVFITSLLSISDVDYGKGAELAKNTFEVGPGKVHYYFTRRDVEELLSVFTITHLEETRELEVIVNTARKTSFWRVIARR